MTATISLAAANAQQERVRAIMAKTGCTFEQAVDAYIKEKLDNKMSKMMHQPNSFFCVLDVT